MLTWTVVLKVRCSPNPTVLCIFWMCTHSRVTARVSVLKTTRFPCSNRRCCHIRVFHPYLTATSPPLIILRCGQRAALVMHYWPSKATSAGMAAHLGTICSPTGLVSLHLPEILDLLFICVPAGAQHSLAGRSHVQFQGILCRFDHISAETFSCDVQEAESQTAGTKLEPNSVSPTITSCIILSLVSMHPPEMIPHLWVVKRPAYRWSTMAATLSLEASWRAKTGCYQALKQLDYFSVLSFNQIIKVLKSLFYEFLFHFTLKSPWCWWNMFPSVYSFESVLQRQPSWPTCW